MYWLGCDSATKKVQKRKQSNTEQHLKRCWTQGVNDKYFTFVLRNKGVRNLPSICQRQNQILVFNGASYEKKMETKLKLNFEGVFTVNSFTYLASIFS